MKFSDVVFYFRICFMWKAWVSICAYLKKEYNSIWKKLIVDRNANLDILSFWKANQFLLSLPSTSFHASVMFEAFLFLPFVHNLLLMPVGEFLINLGVDSSFILLKHWFNIDRYWILVVFIFNLLFSSYNIFLALLVLKLIFCI